MIIKNSAVFKSAILLSTVISLAGCGGGGGGSPSESPIVSSATTSSSVSSTAVSSSLATSSSSSSTSLSSSVSSSSLVSSSSADNSSVSSSSSSSATNSASNSAKSFTLTGVVTDKVIPFANVTFYVGNQTYTTTADANGKYSIKLSANEADFSKPIKAVAKGGQDHADVEFVSLLPSFNTLLAQAGSDATLDSVENLAVNITNVTTAEYALIEQSKFNLATDADLSIAQKGINETEKRKLAALIKLVVDNTEYNLPNGVNSTLDLVINKATSDAYAATLNTNVIESTIKTILNDKSLTPSTPLLGSWVMDDANLQYPNKTVAVISFINNTDFMFVRVGKQPDSTNCSSGVEFGTYSWNQTTGAMDFKATKDGNGDCGVARADKTQTFTTTIAGNELTLNGGVFKKVAGNYPLAGTWTLVDSEKRLNLFSYISSTTLIAYGSESWGYMSYSYNATTGDLRTKNIAASNEDYKNDFIGVVTNISTSKISSYDTASKATDIWTELSHLEYQFPSNNASELKVGTLVATNGDTYPLRVTITPSADAMSSTGGMVKSIAYDFHKIDGTMTPCVQNTQNSNSCIGASGTLTSSSSLFLGWSGQGIKQTFNTAVDQYGFSFTGELFMDTKGIEWKGTWKKIATQLSTQTGEGTFSVNPSLNLNSNSAIKIVAEDGGNDRSALIAPNGGQIWKSGQQETITWMTEFITGASVDLYVLHDDPKGLVGNVSQTVGATVNSKIWYKFAGELNNTGSYKVDPAILKGEGNAYMILVVSTTDNTKFDISDNTFTLQ